MQNGIKYIILIAINIALVIVLGFSDVSSNKVTEKALQVAIVIVTFIIFRMYMQDRGVIKKK